MDSERRLVKLDKIPGKVIGSPLEIVGYKTRTPILKNEMISSFSIDRRAKLSRLEMNRSKAEISKAASLWQSPYDRMMLNARQFKKSQQSDKVSKVQVEADLQGTK